MKAIVGSSGGGQIKGTNEQVLVAEFHARSANGSNAYAGGSDVGRSNGRELTPGESFVLNFNIEGMDAHAGRTLISELYVIAEPGDLVDWAVIAL